ncbi:hypothetical protein GCM10027569_72100 [Flindersiella endophytica]
MRGLSQPALCFTPDDLAHVLEVAATVARVYGFEHVGVGHIAVALAATSRRSGTAINAMADAFGLGTLESSGDIVSQHLVWLEESGSEPQTSSAENELIYGPTPRAQHWHRAATLIHLGLRAAAFIALLIIAVRSGDPWAWPVAFAALVSTRDARESRLPLGDEVSPAQPAARWPWLGCLVAVAGFLGLWASASVIVVLYLLLEAASCAGVRIASRYLWMEGSPGTVVSKSVARQISVVDGYTARQRCLRLEVIAVLGVLPSAATAGGSPTWPLYVMVAVFAARRWTLCAVIASALALGLEIGPAWLLLSAWAGGAAARTMIAWIDRPPTAALPMAGPGIGAFLSRRGRAHLKARRLVRIGRPGAALISLQTAGAAADPTLTALRGWALLHSGHPGEAKSAVSAGPASTEVCMLITFLAELDLSNAEAAGQALTALGTIEYDDVSSALWYELLVARARLTLLSEGGSEHLTDGIARGVPRRLRRRDLLPAVRLLRLASEGALSSSPALSSMLAGLGTLLSRPDPDAGSAGFIVLGRSRPLVLENLRCIVRRALAELRAGRANTETIAQLGAAQGAVGYLMRMNRPVEAAGVLNSLADELTDTPQYRLTAMLSRIEALAMLNAVRHQLTDSGDRRHWWDVFGRTVEDAMREATAGQDWQSLAELIESARLQLGPGKDGVASSRNVAPFIRVRGTSCLEQAHWYRPGEQPPSYALEDLADRVLGSGTWWWSTWSTGTELFWALVPPDGPVSGGVLPMGRGSVLGDALCDLQDALRDLYPDDSDENRNDYVDEDLNDQVGTSPLIYGPPEAETELSRRMGILLPTPLVEALLHTSQPLRLAIAPAAELANVPWACVGVPEHPQSDLRLIERCVPAIAPPAGLLAAVCARSRTATSTPLTLAVIDPGSELAGATREPLPTAPLLLDILPPGVEIITPSESISVEDFAARLRALRALAPEASAVFACHTDESDDSAPSCGLLLRPAIEGDRPHTSAELLTARRLIEEPTRFPMPRVVLMLACESGDLRNAAAGEWLVLGPAMLWAGSDRLIVTSYPIIDAICRENYDVIGGEENFDVIDRHLLRLLIEQQPLAQGLRTVQLTQLASWRATRHQPPDGQDTPRSSPIHWAGHVAMGAFADSRPLPPLHPIRRRLVHGGVVQLLDAAAKRAARSGRSLAMRDLLIELALHGFEEDLPRWRRLSLRAAAYPYTLLTTAFPRRPNSPRVTAAAIGPDIQSLLRSASQGAHNARHRVVSIEHVLAAMLGAPGSTGRIARVLFSWDPRQPEVAKEILGDTQYGYQQTGLPELQCLDLDGLATIYAALDVPIPLSEDGQLRLLSDG